MSAGNAVQFNQLVKDLFFGICTFVRFVTHGDYFDPIKNYRFLNLFLHPLTAFADSRRPKPKASDEALAEAQREG